MAKRKKKGGKKKFLGGFSFKITDHVDPLYLKVLAGAILFMSLMAATLIVVTQLREQKALAEEQEQMLAFQQGLNQVFNHLTLSDFIFPEQYGGEYPQIYLQREPRDQWTAEEIEQYWIPIEETGLEDLTQQNRDLITDILEEGP